MQTCAGSDDTTLKMPVRNWTSAEKVKKHHSARKAAVSHYCHGKPVPYAQTEATKGKGKQRRELLSCVPHQTLVVLD